MDRKIVQIKAPLKAREVKKTYNLKRRFTRPKHDGFVYVFICVSIYKMLQLHPSTMNDMTPLCIIGEPFNSQPGFCGNNRGHWLFQTVCSTPAVWFLFFSLSHTHKPDQMPENHHTVQKGMVYCVYVTTQILRPLYAITKSYHNMLSLQGITSILTCNIYQGRKGKSLTWKRHLSLAF